MIKRFVSPAKYYQGPGVLAKVGRYASEYGSRALILISEGGMKRLGDQLQASFDATAASAIFTIFHGESTMQEMLRVSNAAKAAGACVVIGVGAGKVLDTAKGAAIFRDLPVIICPTAASSDAPCSAAAGIYRDDGSVDHFIHMKLNPDLVLVDSEIIAASPIRLTAAGMGDALATYFEARSAFRTDHERILETSMTLAKLSYDILMKHGRQAMADLRAGQLTDDVEAIIEANTLLSALGFENTGLAAAHTIHNGFSHLPECHSSYHGEKVALGLLVQLILEGTPQKEWSEVLAFCLDIGLPVTLEQIGITDLTSEKLDMIVDAVIDGGDSIRNTPFPVSKALLRSAIEEADRRGRTALEERSRQ